MKVAASKHLYNLGEITTLFVISTFYIGLSHSTVEESEFRFGISRDSPLIRQI